MADQAMYHQGNQSVFVGGRLWTLLSPPALLKRERKEERKGEKFYIYSDVTHTHPAGAGSTLKGKRKKKADAGDGQKAKTAQGGEGNERTSRTNLRGEMDLTKTEHTPKTPRHITERHAGRIRDQMGD